MQLASLALVLFCAAGLASQSGAPTKAAPQETDPAPEPAPVVAANLYSNVSVAGAGSEFEVAVVLDVPTDWHVYWKNPGDSGMATTAKLDAPAGYRVEGPLHTGPQAINLPGGMRSYGYEGQAALFFKVTAPRTAVAGPARFKASVDWLVCKSACFLGKAAPTLELETGTANVPAAGAHAKLLDRQRALLPRPWKEISRQAAPLWTLLSADTGEGARVSMALSLPDAQRITFFPSPECELPLVGQEFTRERESGRLAVAFEFAAAEVESQPRARGVLRVERGLEVAYYEIDTTGKPSNPDR